MHAIHRDVLQLAPRIRHCCCAAGKSTLHTSAAVTTAPVRSVLCTQMLDGNAHLGRLAAATRATCIDWTMARFAGC